MSEIRGIKRAILSVSDKAGLRELAEAMVASGTELFASGGTLKALADFGLPVRKVEELSRSPEAFQGRMKTLSFPIFSGILFRRDDAFDGRDRITLDVPEIDAVVVNFYPFETAARDAAPEARTELIDIGGPALVRAAAKNAKDVLVLADPARYPAAIRELRELGGTTLGLRQVEARRAWNRVERYDRAIAEHYGAHGDQALRYGENPHQKAWIEVDPDSPIDWRNPCTAQELSYNNILDLSSAYELLAELVARFPGTAATVIVKHNNPCGVAVVPKNDPSALRRSLELAWAGDETSAFGGVVAFSEKPDRETLAFFEKRFVELVGAPGLDAKDAEFREILAFRKNLKAIRIDRFERPARVRRQTVAGGLLLQTPDTGVDPEIRFVTGEAWSADRRALGDFGVLVARALKSNAIALVRSVGEGVYQLLGAGQGQPNRIEAIEKLAVPRAIATLQGESIRLEDAVFISDAFFPFRDSIDVISGFGIKYVLQPGGSIRDDDVIAAAREAGVSMAFTGRRHFRH